MFNKTTFSKVKFQDQQLDDYVLENSVLQSKLQSKIDALSIMSRELDKCSMERDRYKVLVEQLMCKKTTPNKRPESESSMYKFTLTNTLSGSDMLAKTQDQNNMLKLEIENLRSKLEEATGDIVAVRRQLQRKDSAVEEGSSSKKLSNFTYCNKDYEQLVNELEKIKKKYQQLQLDYRATLDEKEELVCDRDYYKSKVQRLNHQISYVLSNRAKIQDNNDEDSPKPLVDIDALVTENKYLHERITQLQVEKEIVKRTLTKYKTLLDNRNKNYSAHIKKGFPDVMTQKQVREFLDNMNPKTAMKQSSAAELKSLCLGLFEALNDKSIALQHQRKTNQILANRITELEKTLESWCNGQKCIPIFPSQMLLDESLPETGSVNADEPKQKHTNESQKRADNWTKYPDSDEEANKDGSDGSPGDLRNDCQNDGTERRMSKTVLPLDLQELVKEALANLKPADCLADSNNHLS